MDWTAVNFDWNRARAFLVTAEEGSLSAAARALNMTQPTLGRQVTALEDELGVALFERVGRGLSLTPSGLELMEYVRAMGEAANKFSLAASGRSQVIEGSICISASEVHAAFLLPPIIAKLRKAEPGIMVEVVASNKISDLRRREADIAIRNIQPSQPELIGKKIKQTSARLYAAKRYLDTLGRPTTTEQLNKAEFIGFDNTDRLMLALNERGLNLSKNNFPIVTENHLVQWEMVKQGLGIGFMPEDIANREPLVECPLPDLEPIEVDMWLTTHRELNTSRRVRLVFDFLLKELAK